MVAAKLGYIDYVIMPHRTRLWLIRALQAHKGRPRAIRGRSTIIFCCEGEMDDFVVNIFLGEIRKQAGYAKQAIENLDDLIADPKGGTQPVFRALDEFLGDVARVRSMLWPVREKGKPRGQILRDILRLDSDNPLADATLRNHLEHFDERLDVWAEESKNRIFVDSNIGPRMDYLRFQKGEIMRHYVPDEMIYLFRGDEFDIGRIAAALDDLILGLDKVGTHKSASVTSLLGRERKE